MYRRRNCSSSPRLLLRLDRSSGGPRRADLLVDRRQLVRDPAVAVDARLALAERDAVRAHRAPALLGEVHVLVVMAVAALLRVVRAHPRPLALGELDPLVLELFRRVDAAEHLVQHLVRRLDLADDLRAPLLRHVAVGTSRAHARAVRVVDRVPVLLEHVLLHLVARDAEALGVRHLERPVESTPEDNAGGEQAERGPRTDPLEPRDHLADRLPAPRNVLPTSGSASNCGTWHGRQK